VTPPAGLNGPPRVLRVIALDPTPEERRAKNERMSGRHAASRRFAGERPEILGRHGTPDVRFNE